ncbi:MAG TPA: hypothetical protein VJS37_13555 [Terriglobales bacterium]|nr:hypothetical protein [Terriglobales bacterium]
MRKLRSVLSVFVCLCSTGLWAVTGASNVFVSTGTAGIIYNLNTTSGSATAVISSPGSDFEGMVVAPNNIGQAAGDETTRYMVYVCDTANSKIWRFDPSLASPTLMQVYNGSSAALRHPQCGRITANGDLVVSSTDAGSGLWVFTDVTDLSSIDPPTQLVMVPGSSQGLAQKNTGDLLVVDNTSSKVLRTPSSIPASTQPFISSGLSQPFGIARRGDGFIYVGNQGNGKLQQFDAAGANPTTCATFKNKDVPNFMQMALDNTLYVAVASNSSGSVRSINANNCQLIRTYGLSAPAVGIALPPTMTAQKNVSAANGVAQVNFGFSAFVLNQIVGSCGGTISVGLASPAAIQTLITASGAPSSPAVNLGLDGFEALYSTANLDGCFAGSAVSQTTNFQLSNLLSAGISNPQIVVCSEPTDPGPTNCQPLNTNLSQIGGFPLGGYLPADWTASAAKSLRCRIFMVNAPPVASDPTQAAGIFCGFQSPVNNTFTGVLNSWALSAASGFVAGKSVPVKFKLASGACQNGPYVSNATAILSVAQILDSKGNNVFVPIGLISNGSSGLAQPIFKGDNNNQYLFNWDSSSCIMPSGVTQVCPKGTYSMTVMLLTNNTSGGTQSVYGAQTTLVQLK